MYIFRNIRKKKIYNKIFITKYNIYKNVNLRLLVRYSKINIIKNLSFFIRSLNILFILKKILKKKKLIINRNKIIKKRVGFS